MQVFSAAVLAVAAEIRTADLRAVRLHYSTRQWLVVELI